MRLLSAEGMQRGGVSGAPLTQIIWRWVRGFHAALYSEFLPENEPKCIHAPFPHYVRIGSEVRAAPVFPQQLMFADLMRRNRLAKCLDRLECNDGQCVYECTWVRLDHGAWACVFALDIRDWARLADRESFEARGCTGMYEPAVGRPRAAAKCTDLRFEILSKNALDPFSD